MADETKKIMVREGDTLWSIAHRELGNSARWPELVELNKELLARRAWLPADVDIALPVGEDPNGPVEPSQL